MLVTHRPSALRLVDRVMVIDEGRLVADGKKAEIMTQLASNKAASAATVARVPAQEEQKV